jgi:hypothetical protein
MNRGELTNIIKETEGKIRDMQEDLVEVSHLLSASSSLAIIIRIINLTKELEDYNAMLDIIKFDEITRGLDLS